MARKEKKYHYLYKTICIITKRYYIGIHSTDNLGDGYLGSGRKLKHSIKKYGKKNHTKEIIEFFDNRESLRKKEAEIVTLAEIAKNDCMNLNIGGGQNANCGGYLTNEHKAKISAANSGVNNGMYGKNFIMPEERKQKIKIALLNSEKLKKSRTSQEYKDKISKAFSQPIYILNKDKQIIAEFKNMNSATNFLGCKEANIFNARRFGRMVKRKYWIIYKKDYKNECE